MPEATMVVTGSYLTPSDTADTVTVTFTPADARDITNAKIALSKSVVVNTTAGAIPSTTLLQTPGGYRVSESNGTTTINYVIPGTANIDLSSVNAGTAQFDASGIGVITIEDIPAGSTYTTVLADASKQKRSVSATAVAARIDGSVAFGVGTTIEFVQWGAGRLTFSAINGAVLRQPDAALITRKQYSAAVVEKITSTDWLLSGDTAVT